MKLDPLLGQQVAKPPTVQEALSTNPIFTPSPLPPKSDPRWKRAFGIIGQRDLGPESNLPPRWITYNTLQELYWKVDGNYVSDKGRDLLFDLQNETIPDDINYNNLFGEKNIKLLNKKDASLTELKKGFEQEGSHNVSVQKNGSIIEIKYLDKFSEVRPKYTPDNHFYKWALFGSVAFNFENLKIIHDQKTGISEIKGIMYAEKDKNGLYFIERYDFNEKPFFFQKKAPGELSRGIEGEILTRIKRNTMNGTSFNLYHSEPVKFSIRRKFNQL
ncbi:MAG: hypothetical protein KC475_10565 [Cyanobacteria bacterium HKST-UBA03]|nr:hypothetical protein [Cyanobacteria bacterium HKST-UBA03]